MKNDSIARVAAPARRSCAARVLAGALCVLALAACSDSSSGATDLGGTLSGLKPGASVTLRNNNNSTSVTLTENGPFRFPIFVRADDPYDVVVETQPVGQTCAVTNGRGFINSSGNPVDSIVVNCA